MSLRRRAVLALAPSLGLSVPAIAQDMRARIWGRSRTELSRRLNQLTRKR